MLEPPPTATNPSNAPSVANAIASLNDASVGSMLTLSNSTASIASSRRDSSVIATASLLAIRGSVTTITRRAPSRRISYPTSRVTPGPNLMLEVSIVYAVSRLLPLTIIGPHCVSESIKGVKILLHKAAVIVSQDLSNTVQCGLIADRRHTSVRQRHPSPLLDRFGYNTIGFAQLVR